MQTSSISSQALSPEEDRRQQFYVQLLQDNRSVNGLLDLLSVVVEREDWKRLQAKGKPLTFRAYVELPFPDGGIGWSIDNLRLILKLQHDQERPERCVEETAARLGEMRARIEKLLSPAKDDLPEQEVGKGKPGPGRGKKTGSNTTRFGEDRGRDYQSARLIRDRPDLYERVLAGDLSRNAAMLEAGFRRPTLTVPQEPKAAARAILRHFRGDDLTELLQEIDRVRT